MLLPDVVAAPVGAGADDASSAVAGRLAQPAAPTPRISSAIIN
jgi:hypothetical protein